MTDRDTPEALRETIERYNDAWNRQDVDAIVSMHAPGFVFHNWTANERVEGDAVLDRSRLRLCDAADELVLCVVIEAKVLRPVRQHVLPLAALRHLEQPRDLWVDRVAPRRHGDVAELGLGLCHVHDQRLCRRPGRLADLAAGSS